MNSQKEHVFFRFENGGNDCRRDLYRFTGAVQLLSIVRDWFKGLEVAILTRKMKMAAAVQQRRVWTLSRLCLLKICDTGCKRQWMPLTFPEKRYIIAWPRSGIRRSNSAAIDGDRLYEPRVYVRFPFPPTWKRSFFQRDSSPETRLGFRIKMCVENALDSRTTDLRLSWSMDFTRTNFFYSFDGIGKIFSLLWAPLSTWKPSILEDIAILINWK